MDYFVTLAIGINVNGEWFLPFQQVKLIDMEERPMVHHNTRSGFKIPSPLALHLHYLVEREGVQFYLPYEAGYVTDKEIPKEWVNRWVLEEKYKSDNITDYIEAARKYLNITIKSGPDIAWWRMIRPTRKEDKAGSNLPKDEVQKR